MERTGLFAALLSSALGGTAVVATRYLAGALDPLTVGAVRFAGGFLILSPLAALNVSNWPSRKDWFGTAALGLLLFGLSPVLFNLSLVYTTAARGALALSTVPLLTILAGAVLRVERATSRRSLGVAVAMAGVAVTLARSLTAAPPGAWRGDIIMVGAALCMALYNVWSRPFIARSGALPFAACGMGVGAALLSTISLAAGGAAKLAGLDTTQWLAVAYLAGICGALIFFLWAFALGRTSPTLVGISVAVNPITAALLGTALLHEPVGLDLAIGLTTVLVGIGIAGQRTSGGGPKA